MKTKTRIMILVAVAVMLLALSACGRKSYETAQAELPDYYPGTYVYFEYEYPAEASEDVPDAILASVEMMGTGPQKDADGNDILEFTVKQDGTLVVNGKEYAARYEVLEEAPELGGSLYSEDGYYCVGVSNEDPTDGVEGADGEYAAAISQAAGGYFASVGVEGIKDEETGEYSHFYYYNGSLYVKQ